MKKILALALAVVTVVSLFAGCSGSSSDEIVLPKIDIEDTVENRQKAAVEIAKAYWRKNPYVQYDNRALTEGGFSMGWRSQRDWDSTPEHASEDLTVYTVCSSFTYDTAFQSVGVSIMNDRALCLTKDISKGSGIDEAAVVYKRVNDTDDAAANEKAAAEVQAMLQPGDIINYFRYSGSGHSVLFVGDLNGDGKGDILHSDGKGFDFTAGVDDDEPDGTILFNHTRAPSAEDFLFNPSFSEYLPKANYYAIVRPSLLDTKEYPLTEQAKTRLLYPDMSIFYTAECGNYGSVNVDGELTYTLTVRNDGTQDYEGILVQIPAPANSKIVKINGEASSAKVVKFELSIPAGTELSINYSVVPTGGVGSVIEAVGGYVHTLNLPRIVTAVQKTSYDAAAVSAAVSAAAGKDGADFANAVWKALDPNAPEIPDFETVRSALFERKTVGEMKLYAPKEDFTDATAEELALSRMLAPEYFGGRMVITPAHNRRVLTLRYQDLQPGDVMIFATNSMLDSYYAVFDGTFMVIAENGQNKSLLDIQYENFLAKDLFVVLRPAQAM